jgi:hypothetical protein
MPDAKEMARRAMLIRDMASRLAFWRTLDLDRGDVGALEVMGRLLGAMDTAAAELELRAEKDRQRGAA